MKSKPIETNNAKQSKRMGRPRAVIDWKIFNGLCEIQCTEKEIATVFHVSADTIERACQREKGMTFADYFAQKREDGRVSLRRKQWKLADRNAAMAIFLGKNYLGQADRQELTGAEGEPLFAQLTEAEINAEIANEIESFIKSEGYVKNEKGTDDAEPAAVNSGA